MYGNRVGPAIAVLSLALISSAARLSSRDSTQVSGSAELTYSQQHALDVPDAPGHQLLAGETKGTNQNTGGGEFMSNVPVVNVETADLVQGNGTHQGYYTMGKAADTLVAKWEGKVKTTMAGNQARTTFEGTWEYVKGTGRYATATGKGTYSGQFLAKDRYVVKWQGQYNK